MSGMIFDDNTVQRKALSVDLSMPKGASKKALGRFKMIEFVKVLALGELFL